MLRVVLTAVLFVHWGSSEASLPRCRDSVCARDPHCTRSKLPAVCWNVSGLTAAPCRCCQNCINPDQYISEDCAQKIRACNPLLCPQVLCAYGSYVPDCDCCTKCLPKECNGVHDGIWPNCDIVDCAGCINGKEPFYCPKTCCPVCI
ncbi:hypothetical protein HPB48_008117 [Haemaphysalis longicornis]|uniref:Uncharacterized protein n=1 Tax=Haemaphysalis longicornis TaxID=44386 RepID=A0A9J6FTU8_HAELO|nr:hypothetical protein HPB48_008117 [Haemaphysalis longicornis]